MACYVVTTAVSTEYDAENIALRVVWEGLAASVKISDARSRFFWKGSYTRRDEKILTIITSGDIYALLEARIKELHPYELPEIIATEIDGGSREFLDWIAASADGREKPQ